MAVRQKTAKKDETGIFLAIVGVLAVPLTFALQADGVIEIPWAASIIVYVVILAGFVCAYLRWKSPSRTSY